jgi:hypothetical protein
MAVAFVQGVQAQFGSVTFGAATAGNMLVLMVNQTSTTATPIATGWTQLSATSAVYSTSYSSIFYLYKIAAGGETSITPVAGSGGTLNGLLFWEISGLGALPTVDTIQPASNLSSTGNNTTAITTTKSTDIVLVGTGAVAGMASMTWDAALTGVSTVGITAGAYSIPGTTLSAKSYTNTLGSGRAHANLVVAISPTPVVNVAIAQVAANLTLTGGTQTVASIRNVAIAQVAANLTLTGGTQTVVGIVIITEAYELTMLGIG